MRYIVTVFVRKCFDKSLSPFRYVKRFDCHSKEFFVIGHFKDKNVNNISGKNNTHTHTHTNTKIMAETLILMRDLQKEMINLN